MPIILDVESQSEAHRASLPRKFFRNWWLRTLKFLKERCECEDGVFPYFFDDALVVGTAAGRKKFWLRFPAIVEKVLNIGRWHVVDHDTAHAALAYFGSPFRSAVVLTYDASTVAHYGRGMELRELSKLQWNFGCYKNMGYFMPEVMGMKEPHELLCNRSRLLQSEDGWMKPGQVDMPLTLALGVAGKLMGYAGTTEARTCQRVNRKNMKKPFEKERDVTCGRLLA